MTPERWQTVRGILQSAMEMRPADRAAFLDRECAVDPTLRQDVDKMLSAQGKLDPDFQESPAAEQVEVPTQSFASASTMAAGTRLGNYEVRALLGAGGMGQVYRARDLLLKREVAIKIIPDFYSSDPARLYRFRQEAEMTAALNHPNILTVYQVGQQDTTFYIVAELLLGDTLRDRLKAGSLPLRSATDYGVQIARGLAAAHESGVIHRDLKPENIFVTKDGRIKILDFGLAKLIERPPERRASDEKTRSTQWTDPGLALGTTAYMSPEQVRGSRVDHRSDIFAFGSVMHEMLTGRLAFAKGTSAETMTAILNEDPPALSNCGQNIPPGMQRVIQRCLEKQPERRFQSASDLAFALEALSDSGSPAAVVAGRKSSARRTFQRLSLMAGAGLLAAGCAAAIWYLHRPLPPPRVTEYTQITHDGHPKILAGTDGIRLYFTQISPTYMSPRSLAEVAATGGEISEIPVAVPGAIFMAVDVSPDGSSALLASSEKGNPAYAFWSARLVGGSLHRLLGSAQGAVYSPDGRSVAYTTVDGDLWIMASDGTGAHKVGPVGGGGAHMPAWSPDGRSIRFQTRDRRIWEIASNGSNPHRLLPGWHEVDAECCGHWTPDGKFFVFVSGELWGNRGQIWAIDERRGLLRQPPVEPIQLTSGPTGWGRPIPSRDGKKIFAEGTSRHGELSRYDAKSGQFQPFLKGISAEGVAFSRDGASVAYVSYPEGILWKANRDGSDPVQLTERPMNPMNPRWSPDGKQILFMDAAENLIESYIVSTEGGSPRRLLPEVDQEMSEPNWSPDGKKVLFASRVAGDPNGYSLRILDVATGQVTAVPGSVGLSSPRWSSDGQKIAAVTWQSTSLHGQQTALKVYDTEKQQWSVLVTTEGIEYPAFSADSQFLHYLVLGSDQAVYRVRVKGGGPERVVDLKDWHMTGYFSFWMGLDPTDALLLLRDDGTSDLYALTLEEK